MKTERVYTNCKHWMFSCPHKDNESMAKTESHQPPVQYLGSHDADIINKLCAACSKFEKDD